MAEQAWLEESPGLLEKAFRRLERAFDQVFGSANNPLRQLGTLAFFALWLLAATGVWLYIVFDTSVAGAYESIDALSRSPWSPGGVVRSLHRYAADAFVLLTVAHLTRELLFGRWRHFRRFTWLTGIALVPLIAVSAIGGFWLNWDQLGQFSATATAEWVDALPLQDVPFARNFIAAAAVSDRLFSLLVFIHLGVPLLLVYGLWFHIQRITRAAVFPSRGLALGSFSALLMLGVLLPVRSQGQAAFDQVPEQLSLDWVLLWIHPFMYATSAATAWALAIGVLFGLLLLPFLPQRVKRAAIAVVDPQNCNGCERCFADCPYAAVTMVPHPNQRIGRQLAVVDADMCAGCGICAGSCPSSTPFRRGQTLATGIDMPQRPVGELRQQLREGLSASQDQLPIAVFCCREGADASDLRLPGTVVLPLLCAGQLPPSFVEYALRDGAAGVVVASCRDGGCSFRLGARWTSERLAGAREPHLRPDLSKDRVMLVPADLGEEVKLSEAVVTLRNRLRQIKAP